jgi:hypothetical protein
MIKKLIKTWFNKFILDIDFEKQLASDLSILMYKDLPVSVFKLDKLLYQWITESEKSPELNNILLVELKMNCISDENIFYSIKCIILNDNSLIESETLPKQVLAKNLTNELFLRILVEKEIIMSFE